MAQKGAVLPHRIPILVTVAITLTFSVFPGVMFGASPVGATPVPPDPGAPGPYAVSTGYYDIGGQTGFTVPVDSVNDFTSGVEVVGEIDYPTDIAELGQLPVVLIMHGDHVPCYNGTSTYTQWPCDSPSQAIPSYQGFHYLAQGLASDGLVVISISTNGIEAQEADHSTDEGILARAELAEYHLQLLSSWNTSSSGPFGSTFVGHLNLGDVGLIGHSRGGGAVAGLVAYNQSVGDPFGIQAVEQLSPYFTTDLAPDVNGVPLLTMESYCDGDSPDDSGVGYVDLSRYPGDSAPRTLIWLMGGDHFFWDTVQTPDPYPAGLPPVQDDWSMLSGDSGNGTPFADDPQCETDAPTRLSPTGQQAVALTYSRGFMDLHLLGDSDLAPWFEGSVAPPASVDGADLRVNYIPPVSDRLVVNSFSSSSSLTTDDLGQPVTVATGGATVTMCGPPSCATGSNGGAQEPETGYGSVEQAHVTWDSPGASIANSLGNPTDVSGGTILLRVGVDFGVPQPTPDLSVVLDDADGNSASVPVSSSAQPLTLPPGGSPPIVPRETLQTISLPVSDFTGIDPSQVTSINLDFDRTSQGSVMVTDLMVTDLPAGPPSDLPEAPSVVVLPVVAVAVGLATLLWRRRRMRL